MVLCIMFESPRVFIKLVQPAVISTDPEPARRVRITVIDHIAADTFGIIRIIFMMLKCFSIAVKSIQSAA